MGHGRDFGRFDFAAPPPENVRVGHWNALFHKMLVDSRFVGEDAILFRSMSDRHDVDVVEIGSAFAPVAVGEDIESSDLAAGFEFASLGDCPVEEGVETGYADTGLRGFHVLEEGGEAADDLA